MPLRVFRATRFRKLNAHTDRASEREAEGERDGESSSVTGLRCLDCCHKIGQEIASNPGRLDLSDVTGVTCTSLVLEHLFGFETPRCSRPLEAPRRVDDESDWRVLSSPLPLPLPSPDRSIGEIPQRGLIYVTRAHAHRNRARAQLTEAFAGLPVELFERRIKRLGGETRLVKSERARRPETSSPISLRDTLHRTRRRSLVLVRWCVDPGQFPVNDTAAARLLGLGNLIAD